ncbi:hypothetical protein C2845_PM14G06800 [Panicum miliaceum]|uniref:Ubiquitin-like protease family profile domain-containing protein n=1 Tax=Panicum miliaceum TaxID=4540 RepID=A0A3L6PPC2_PANMI|nr:hypothetical protein C2845_PM14G06800 [Panicum miliaceum]
MAACNQDKQTQGNVRHDERSGGHIFSNQQLAEIKMERDVQTRMSKAKEEDLSTLTRAFKDFISDVRNNPTPVVPMPANYQEPSTFGEQKSGMTAQPIGTPSTRQNLQNEATPKPHMTPQRPIFDTDYMLTDEDISVACFLRTSYDDAEIVQVGQFGLTVHMLRPNVTKGFIYDEVFIPMNVCNNHWVLVVLNFIKKEVQIHNSLASNPIFRDEVKETTLVESIQTCIDASVEGGIVQITNPINLTQWKKCFYTNIPQQLTNYCCGAFIMKYMLVWDGENIAEPFTQKEEYLAKYSEKTICHAKNNNDCMEISNPEDDNKSKKMGSTKRKCGCPRKLERSTNSVVQQFSTEAITDRVQKKQARTQTRATYKEPPHETIIIISTRLSIFDSRV